MKRTLVILSGGLDSTVLAYELAASPNHELVGAVSIDYGQKHARELGCAAMTCKALGIQHFLVNLAPLRKLLGNSALTDGGAVPIGHYADASMKDTVVPNRNMILMAVAIGIAINNECQAVAYGAHAGDHAVYPDCRPEFAEAMGAAAALCHYTPIDILRPFIGITKADIVKRGLALGVPFQNTHTCYEGEREACGCCGTCVERLEAFDEAGATDPLEYERPDYWREAIKLHEGPKKETTLRGMIP